MSGGRVGVGVAIARIGLRLGVAIARLGLGLGLGLGLVGVGLLGSGCGKDFGLARKLTSFEVRLLSQTGRKDRRCILAGTPTTGVDLTGCPPYERDAVGATVVRLDFEARALDNRGQLLESYDSLASLAVVPGRIEPGFNKVRFKNGVATTQAGANPFVTFRGSFGDTFLWVTDSRGPPRASDVPGLGVGCSSERVDLCSPLGLSCVNTSRLVGYDADGVVYCTKGCARTEDCPTGYFCGNQITTYYDAASDTSKGACIRRPPSFAAGVAGPVYLVEPNLGDVNRTESLVSSPLQGNFIEVKRGKMVVTAIRIDGFYMTDVCPGGGPPGNREGAASADDPACSSEDRERLPEFNHLFVFNFSRPDDLYEGAQLATVAGPVSQFNGYTELNFPLWEVDFAAGTQAVPPAVNLQTRIRDRYPKLVEPGGSCFDAMIDPSTLTLLDCDLALLRVQSGRVKLTVESALPILPNTPESMALDRYGQWPVTVVAGRRTRTFQMITRDNIPFFSPRTVAGRSINREVSGNLRKVAFDERSEPIWILEPKDQADCPWCMNP